MSTAPVRGRSQQQVPGEIRGIRSGSVTAERVLAGEPRSAAAAHGSSGSGPVRHLGAPAPVNSFEPPSALAAALQRVSAEDAEPTRTAVAATSPRVQALPPPQLPVPDAAAPPPAAPAPAPAAAAPATPAPRRAYLDIRHYVPASGATGLRFSEANAANATPPAAGGSGAALPPRCTPRVPLGVPQLTQAPLASLSAAQREERARRIRLENARGDKWREMLREWDALPPAALPRAAPTSAFAAHVKRRCRKGVPECVRGAVWLRLLGARAALAADPTLYDDLLALPVGAGGSDADGAADAPPPPPAPPSPGASESTLRLLAQPGLGRATVRIIDTIERDINRTFPMYNMFSEIGGIGQTALFRLLVAYAQLDCVVGYCQGMGFIAALFLSYAPEAEAFHMFRALLLSPPHALAALYAPGLPQVALREHTLQGLINTRLPAAAAALHRLGVHPTMWSAQWILTIFTYSFPFAVVVRIWDAFLCEGWKVVYRVALAALRTAEAELVAAAAFEDVMAVFKALPGRLDADALLDAAFAARLGSADIAALEDEYRAITAAGYEPSSAAAGFGLPAHERAAAAAAAARGRR